ncbi:alternate-type signal peptide domain-containing protein [Nocardia seriolae]|nr:alternate-type signal peptide domain-containing protein [Nocardia seriolae]
MPPVNLRFRTLAVAAGGVLLLGGTSFALWNDSDLFKGGSIKSGQMNISGVGVTKWYDVSPDRSDTAAIPELGNIKGHAIADPGSYRVVPGDQVSIMNGYQMVMDGDNLVASLHLNIPDLPDAAANGIHLKTYSVSVNGGTPQTGTIPAKGGSFDIGYVQAPHSDGTGLPDGDLPIVTVPDSGEANITVAVTAEFDAATSGTDAQQAVSDLGDFTVTMQQVRDGQGNWNKA